MIDRQFFKKVAATAAVAGMIFSIAIDVAGAAITLRNGNVNGFIRSNSPSFRFRNQSRAGTPLQTAPGEEYIFKAQRGDIIQVSVEAEDGSSLSPILVLTASQTGEQVAYDDSFNSLRYQVPAAGEYRLLVLGQNNSLGRYSLSISGISQGTASQSLSTQPSSTQAADKRRQLLANEYGLTVLDTCPPARGSLVVVSFPEFDQTYTYCANPNRFVRAGDYTYDASSGELKPGAPLAQTSSQASQTTDSRRQLLQNEFGLRVLDSCPAARTSLVVVSFPEYGQTYTYCANPNRLVRAGEYTYDLSSGELRSGTSTALNPLSPSTSTTDLRRQTLQNEFGLTVLDSCPAATSSLVVVSYPEGSQTYRYCANPNRIFRAGEYTYNARTRNLEVTRKPQECTLTLGGVCIIR